VRNQLAQEIALFTLVPSVFQAGGHFCVIQGPVQRVPGGRAAR
jgi:hypothetical protein